MIVMGKVLFVGWGMGLIIYAVKHTYLHCVMKNSWSMRKNILKNPPYSLHVNASYWELSNHHIQRSLFPLVFRNPK